MLPQRLRFTIVVTILGCFIALSNARNYQEVVTAIMNDEADQAAADYDPHHSMFGRRDLMTLMKLVKPMMKLMSDASTDEIAYDYDPHHSMFSRRGLLSFMKLVKPIMKLMSDAPIDVNNDYDPHHSMFSRRTLKTLKKLAKPMLKIMSDAPNGLVNDYDPHHSMFSRNLMSLLNPARRISWDDTADNDGNEAEFVFGPANDYGRRMHVMHNPNLCKIGEKKASDGKCISVYDTECKTGEIRGSDNKCVPASRRMIHSHNYMPASRRMTMHNANKCPHGKTKGPEGKCVPYDYNWAKEVKL